MPNPGDRVLSLLGLAHRAGAVARGTEQSRRALQRGEVSLVLAAIDASDAQTRKVTRLAGHRQVPVRRMGDRASLGAAVGQRSLSVVAVTRVAFAEQILLHTEGDDEVSEVGRTHAG